MLDLMFLHDKFFAPIPDDLLEYKVSTNKLFPHIYDTKHLMNTRMQLRSHFTGENGSSFMGGLGDCFKRTMQPDFKFD
jgi:hypothetical protein